MNLETRTVEQRRTAHAVERTGLLIGNISLAAVGIGLATNVAANIAKHPDIAEKALSTSFVAGVGALAGVAIAKRASGRE